MTIRRNFSKRGSFFLSEKISMKKVEPQNDSTLFDATINRWAIFATNFHF